ncbi:MAG: extracellular solute-binding protein [Pseudomonadota bacterium]
MRARCLFAILLLLLAACDGVQDERQVVRFWALGSEGEAIAKLIPIFEREHPDIRVELQTVPWTAAHAKLLTAYAGGVLPDVSQVGNTWIAEMAALGALEPLDARVAATPGIEVADYFPGIWQTNVVDGTLYGLPWYVDTHVLFYRRDLLARAGVKRPPQTLDELRRALAAIRRLDGGRHYGMYVPTNEFQPLMVLGLQGGEPLLRDGGRYGNFRSRDFGRALTYYKALFDDGLAPPISNQEISNVYDEFARGYFAFYLTGPWNVEQFNTRLPPAMRGRWATTPMVGLTGPGNSTAGGSSLVLLRTAHAKTAAWTLMAWLSRPDIQAAFHGVSGDLPPRRSVWARGAIAGDPRMVAFASQLEHVRPAPPVPEWERIAELIMLAGQRVARGERSVAAAQAELDQETDRLLERRRWLLARAEARP